MAPKAQRCPYCSDADCAWTISPVSGLTGAEVHTTCGHAFTADNLLGKSRWHLEAALRAVDTPRPPGAAPATKPGRSPKPGQATSP